MFDVIEPFADYSFPKAHATGYGLIAYQTAWLKANFPVQYLAALLTSVKTNLDKAAVYLNECRLLDIPVLVPDVNASASDFSCEFGDATYARQSQPRAPVALRALGGAQRRRRRRRADHRGAGSERPVRRLPRLLRARRSRCAQQAHGRVVDPRRCVRLARTSATGLCIVFEQIVDAALRRRREREQGTMSLFDLGGAGAPTPSRVVFDDRLAIPELEFDKSERLRLEKEMLGLYVSDHPLMGAERALRRHVECSIAELADLDDGAMRTVAGVVTALSRKYTKRGDLMATFVLEDIAASIEVMVFPKTMAQYDELLAPDAIVTVKGRLDGRDDTPKLMALEIARPEIHIDSGPPVRLRVKRGALTADASSRLKRDPRRASAATARCSCTSSAPRRRRCCDSATSSAAAAPTASSPSSASSSAPTASWLKSWCGQERGLELEAIVACGTRATPSPRVPTRPSMTGASWGRPGPAGRGAGGTARERSAHEVLFGSPRVGQGGWPPCGELEKEWGDVSPAALIACDNAWACDDAPS